MRTLLKENTGQRKKFRATFARFGKKINFQGYSATTILLTRITDTETKKTVADHVWFAFTKGFEKAQLKEGDTLEFYARVKLYKKGYVNRQLSINEQQVDYKLSHPSQIRVIK